jgi:hypothetical protein
MQFRVGVLMAVGVLVTAGCGGSTTNGGNDSPMDGGMQGSPVSQSELPSTVAQSFCELLKPCCARANVPFDEAACEKRIASEFARQLASNRYGAYDPAAGGRCLTYSKQVASACGAAVVQNTPFMDNGICTDDLIVGKSPPGGPCDFGNDCIQPASCEIADPTNPSSTSNQVCVSRPHAKEGDACAGSCTITEDSVPYTCNGTPGASGAYCYAEDNLYCDADGTCHSSAPGAPCTMYSCTQSAFCDATNVCQPLGGAGAECSESSTCQRYFYCEPTTMRCTQRLPPFSACSTDEQCASEPRRCVNGHCSFELANVCTGETPPSAN